MRKSEKVAVTIGAVILVPTIALVGCILFSSVTGKEFKLSDRAALKSADTEEATAEDTDTSLPEAGLPEEGEPDSVPEDTADGMPEGQASEPESAAGLNDEKYGQIQDGMSYDDITSLLETEGTDVTGGGLGQIGVFQWYAGDGTGNAMVTLREGMVIGKTRTPSAGQAGTSAIDKDKFDQIETGMSYSETVSVIGSEGILLCGPEQLGGSESLYAWISPDGITNAVVAFQDNQVTSKTQFGL